MIAVDADVSGGMCVLLQIDMLPGHYPAAVGYDIDFASWACMPLRTLSRVTTVSGNVALPKRMLSKSQKILH